MGEFILTRRVTAIADAAESNVLIRVDSDYELVMGIGFRPIGLFDMDLYEGPTVNNQGTSLEASIAEMDRARGGQPNSTFFHTPTIGAVGTQIATDRASAEDLPSLTPRSAVGSGPWILAAGTDYLLSFTNRTGANGDLVIALRFTEYPER